jgi:TetR/AcrR family transcriptional regulator, cholesterol catabolism regulator
MYKAKDELISRISELFKKYGIKSITMDDIAKELGISKKTLYQHFENKNDIVNHLTQNELKSEYEELYKLFKQHSNAIDQLLVTSKYIARNLRFLNLSLTYDMNKYYPHIWGKLISQRRESILNLISQNLKTGIEQGLYQRNLNTDIIAVFYCSLLDVKGFEIVNDSLNEDFDKMFNTLFMYHIHGIANNVGIEYLEKQFKNL